VVTEAINKVSKRLGGSRPDFLAAVLTLHREGLESIRYLPDLAAAVSELVATLDHPSEPNAVAPPGLAEALIEEITTGVLKNAGAGGALRPLLSQPFIARVVAARGRRRHR
jgi:hypothetical protein